MKKIFFLIILLSNTSAIALFGFGDDKKNVDKKVIKEKTTKDCEIPAFAKAIGHEDKWLLHNGCPPRKDAKKNESK